MGNTDKQKFNQSSNDGVKGGKLENVLYLASNPSIVFF